MTLVRASATGPLTGSDLARRTAIGVVVAIVALLVAQSLITVLGVDVGTPGEQNPFAVGSLVGSTVVAGIGAALVYAALDRFTDRPVRNFVVVAVGVFALMLVPVLTVAPTIGVTPTGQAVLVLYHLLVAVPLVAFVVGAAGW